MLAGMHRLAPDDLLPLTCTREGACCFGARIWINPWELAVLARELGIAPLVARLRLTDRGGLRLRQDGLGDRPGQPACTLYRPGHGCSAHPGRPLACRLFPLGRRREAGLPVYYHDPAGLPCLTRCPGVAALPSLSVADYLHGQATALAEAAHDAWAARCYGLVAAAATIARHDAACAATLRATFATWRAADEEARACLPGPGWTDPLTLLPDGVPLDRPAEAADLHAAALAARIAARHGDDLAAAGRSYLGLALRLAPAVGAEPGAMADMLA